MLHIFYVHSYITYIISISVLEKLSLNPSDVIFLYGRGFNSQERADIKSYQLDTGIMKLSKVPSYGMPLLLIKQHKYINQIDALISRVTDGSQYTAYLPLTKNFLMGLIGTHRLCVDIAFIEEGLLTYTGNFKKPPTQNPYAVSTILRYLNHGYRTFVYRPYTFPLPTRLYALHDGVEVDKSEFSIHVVKPSAPTLSQQYILNHASIFVIDTVVEDGITSLDCFKQVIQSFITLCINHNQFEVWLRFRPGLSPDTSLLSLFEENAITTHLIPEHVSVEAVLLRSTNLSVFGLHSSLLFYAALWGHKSYSLLSILFEIDQQAAEKYKQSIFLPSVFYNLVNSMEGPDQ